MCALGEVAASYSSFAQWGWNINEVPPGAPGTWAPGSTNVFYDISTLKGEPLRLVVYDGAGSSWCMPIAAGSGVANLMSFNTHCWDGSGENYDGAPIALPWKS